MQNTMENTNLSLTNNKQQLMPIAVLRNLGTYIKIKEFDKVGHLLIPICNKHAVLSGIDKEIDPFTKEEIAKYTTLHLKNLSFEEIEIAFQNERFNLYDKKTIHYNFFSIDYYVEIVKKYIAWKQNQMTIHNIPLNQTLLPKSSNSTTEESKKQIRREFVTLIHSELKQTKKDYVNDAHSLYEDFVQLELINATKQEKKSVYGIMLRDTVKETNNQLNKPIEKKLRKQLNSFLQILESKDKNILVVNKCKAYLVCKAIASYPEIEPLLKKIQL